MESHSCRHAFLDELILLTMNPNQPFLPFVFCLDTTMRQVINTQSPLVLQLYSWLLNTYDDVPEAAEPALCPGPRTGTLCPAD